MDTTRQKKINSLIQHDMSEIFQDLVRERIKGIIITVTRVSVTSDLSLARINLSMFPVDRKDVLLKEVRQMTPYLRNLLGQRIRHQLRKIPQLEFFIDDSLDYLEKIERSLRGEDPSPIG